MKRLIQYLMASLLLIEPVLLYALNGELLATAEGNELSLPYEDTYVLQIGKTSYLITATRQ